MLSYAVMPTDDERPDQAIWVHTLLLDGRHPETNETIIPKAAIDHITTGFTIQPARAPYPDFSAGMYGHGQMMHTYQGHQVRLIPGQSEMPS